MNDHLTAGDSLISKHVRTTRRLRFICAQSHELRLTRAHRFLLVCDSFSVEVSSIESIRPAQLPDKLKWCDVTFTGPLCLSVAGGAEGIVPPPPPPPANANKTSDRKNTPNADVTATAASDSKNWPDLLCEKHGRGREINAGVRLVHIANHSFRALSGCCAERSEAVAVRIGLPVSMRCTTRITRWRVHLC